MTKIYILKSGAKPLHLSSYRYPDDEDAADYYKATDLVEVDIDELVNRYFVYRADLFLKNPKPFSEYLKEHIEERMNENQEVIEAIAKQIATTHYDEDSKYTVEEQVRKLAESILSQCWPCELCKGSALNVPVQCPICNGTGQGQPILAILSRDQTVIDAPAQHYWNMYTKLEVYRQAQQDMIAAGFRKVGLKG